MGDSIIDALRYVYGHSEAADEIERLRAEPEDDLVDLFPGTGAVSVAWEAWKAEVEIR